MRYKCIDKRHTFLYSAGIMIKIFNFSPEKNKLLVEERGISFEEIVNAILEEKLIDVVDHPNQTKYPGQKLFIVDIDNYVYAVPFVMENKETAFLKTIYPTRKLTKKYIQEINHE